MLVNDPVKLVRHTVSHQRQGGPSAPDHTRARDAFAGERAGTAAGTSCAPLARTSTTPAVAIEGLATSGLAQLPGGSDRRYSSWVIAIVVRD